jgi:hypothetical protein
MFISCVLGLEREATEKAISAFDGDKNQNNDKSTKVRSPDTSVDKKSTSKQNREKRHSKKPFNRLFSCLGSNVAICYTESCENHPEREWKVNDALQKDKTAQSNQRSFD